MLTLLAPSQESDGQKLRIFWRFGGTNIFQHEAQA